MAVSRCLVQIVQESGSHDFQLKSVRQCDYKTTGLSRTVGFWFASLIWGQSLPHHGLRSSRFQGGGQVRSLAHILPSAAEPSSLVPWEGARVGEGVSACGGCCDDPGQATA